MKRSLHSRRAVSLAFTISGAIAAGAVVGCNGRDLSTESDLQLRYDAAQRINAAAERDEAMASVATDAADQGDAAVTRQSLAAIANRKVRNDSAAECAARLVKAGQRADGNQIADTINDPAKRSATFKRLAENDPGPGDPAGKGVRNYLGD